VLSYFYENLITNFENIYNQLSLIDKQKFSSIRFEPSYWCERAANLKGAFLGDDEEILLRKMSLFSKGISLYEKNLYPFMNANYEYTYLYSYRGECKYKMEDYEGAYKDYKKAIAIYERNTDAKNFLKYSITDIYYDFSNICYFLKKYDECKNSIDKGINTYFNGLENYIPTWYKLYTLKGYINFFIYKNKQQACKDWSRAGELGDKDAFDLIKQHCNK
jgi:tetratricopeptide (TPR) repeat protein